MTTEHTAEDYARAELARHEDGILAARTDPWAKYPWAAGSGWASDAEMAADPGWRIVRDADAITAREHLDAAWEAAYVPEDGIIRAGAEYIAKYSNGRMSGPFLSPVQVGAHGTIERRLLDPPAPARPEGAEEWEDWLIEAMPHESMPDGDIARLADQIAARAARRGEDPAGPLRPLTTDERSYRYAQDLGYELPEEPR